MTYPSTRRDVLAGAGFAVTAGLAGCQRWLGGEASPTQAPPSYDHLAERSVYVADDLELSVPSPISPVASRDDADLLVLPPDTSVSAEQAVEWLANERVVALVGPEAESTWLRWASSDAYADAFGSGGLSETEPKPDLLVAFPERGLIVTDRTTWGNDYDARDVFEAIEEALGPE